MILKDLKLKIFQDNLREILRFIYDFLRIYYNIFREYSKKFLQSL